MVAPPLRKPWGLHHGGALEALPSSQEWANNPASPAEHQLARGRDRLLPAWGRDGPLVGHLWKDLLDIGVHLSHWVTTWGQGGRLTPGQHGPSPAWGQGGWPLDLVLESAQAFRIGLWRNSPWSKQSSEMLHCVIHAIVVWVYLLQLNVWIGVHFAISWSRGGVYLLQLNV